MESLSGTDMLILAHARSVAAANISSLTTMAVGMESDVNSFFTLSEAFLYCLPQGSIPEQS